MLRPADDTITRQLRQVMKEHHPDLVQAGVNVNVLVSDKGVRHHGRDAYAKIKIANPEARAQLPVDAVLTIDGKAWNRLEEATQRALLDHELEHLVVSWEYLPWDPDSDDDPSVERREPKLDEYDRPKLNMRSHDFEVGWFKSVAERHGEWSIERRQAADLAVSDMGQVFWLAALPVAGTGTDGRATGRRAPTLGLTPLAPPTSRDRSRLTMVGEPEAEPDTEGRIDSVTITAGDESVTLPAAGLTDRLEAATAKLKKKGSPRRGGKKGRA